MASKRPLYTLIGWTVWKAAKLYVKRRAKGLVPSNKVLALGVASVIVAGAAASVASSSSADA